MPLQPYSYQRSFSVLAANQVKVVCLRRSKGGGVPRKAAWRRGRAAGCGRSCRARRDLPLARARHDLPLAEWVPLPGGKKAAARRESWRDA